MFRIHLRIRRFFILIILDNWVGMGKWHDGNNDGFLPIAIFCLRKGDGMGISEGDHN